MSGLTSNWLSFVALYTCKFHLAAAAGYDFVIIGGGTAGLAVANRLTEIPSITVAVIEAGGKVFDNTNVTAVDGFTRAIGTAIDWQYKTANQVYAAGQEVSYANGKALGGTSTINGMTYVRAQKAQIDSWEAIGNEGWSWDDLLPYYKKSENFTVPTAAEAHAGASYDASYHGKGGPLSVGYSYDLLNGSFHSIVQGTWANLGIPLNNDSNGGDVRGFSVWPSTLDSATNLREDAARAYYYPIQNRTNLHIFLDTTANKIVWEDSISGKVVAKGVQITSSNGSVEILKASKEVIVSAGSLRTPAILELSGIGNPIILEKNDITTKVDLPAVGENLVDQPLNGIQYNVTDVYDGITSYVAFGAMNDLHTSLPSRNTTYKWASQIATAINNSISESSINYLLEIQYDHLKQQVPNAEAVVATTRTFGLGPTPFSGASMWPLMPFSRGNVHIKSPDSSVFPVINPNYFLIDFDLDVSVAIFKWVRKFWATAPISAQATEVNPSYAFLPLNSTDEELGSYIKTNFGANNHPIGTASMMPRERGGVVDCRLKVYGTRNVRVVDASIFPTQVSGHLTSTIYAIAEKAVDMIKQDFALHTSSEIIRRT